MSFRRGSGAGGRPEITLQPRQVDCPKCGFLAEGQRDGTRMRWQCGACGVKFSAPLVLITVEGETVPEPPRRRR